MQNKQHMKEFVIGLLKEKLPAYYYYHNYEHSLYVMEKAMEIGKQENCTQDELELLEVAALWHDAGLINTFSGHEEAGCDLVKAYLPGYGYTKRQINKICGMIRATKIPQIPKNKLEKILADADLEYLGTTAAAEKAGNLFKELQYINPGLTVTEWNRTQVDFLQKHRFFTGYCRKLKAPVKAAYLKSLVDNIV